MCIFSHFLSVYWHCNSTAENQKSFFYLYPFGEISKGSLFKVPRGHKPSKGPCKASHKISQLTCEGLGRSSTRFLMCWRRTWLAARYKGGPSFIWYPTSRKPENGISNIQPHVNLNMWYLVSNFMETWICDILYPTLCKPKYVISFIQPHVNLNMWYLVSNLMET